jgi:hypothetical protein
MTAPLKTPSWRDLLLAPELASLAVLDAALAVAEQSLYFEHRIDDSLDAPDPDDAPVLVAARLLITRIAELRGLLDWYRAAVGRPSRQDPEHDLPF